MIKKLLILTTYYFICAVFQTNLLFANTHLIVLGPPGSGKGTFVNYLGTLDNFTVISTGDLLRSEAQKESRIGLQIRRLTDQGDFVPNTIVWELIGKKLEATLQFDETFILDGYPSTESNFYSLDSFLQRHPSHKYIFIVFKADLETCAHRISNRIICRTCGEIFNTLFIPPKIQDRCDHCGNQLSKRKDDSYANGVRRFVQSMEKIQGVLQLLKIQNYVVNEIDSTHPLLHSLKNYKKFYEVTYGNANKASTS